MATYLRCWQQPDMKLFQLGWRQSRCRAHSEPGSSSSSTARPRCSQSSRRIGQSHRFHCRLCTRWRSEVGNLTPEPPASPSYLQNPPRTQEASVWSLELFCVLLMRKEDQDFFFRWKQTQDTWAVNKKCSLRNEKPSERETRISNHCWPTEVCMLSKMQTIFFPNPTNRAQNPVTGTFSKTHQESVWFPTSTDAQLLRLRH